MATLYEDGERIVLSGHDLKILIALLVGNMTGYQIKKQSQGDSSSEFRMSSGTLYPALARLKTMAFIGQNKNGTFKITSLGKQVLEWEIDHLEKMVKLARERAAKG